MDKHQKQVKNQRKRIKFIDEENLELTDFIKKSVQGIASEEKIEVINAAIKRYFTSQKEAENRQKKNKTEIHKRDRRRTKERKSCIRGRKEDQRSSVSAAPRGPQIHEQ